MRSRVLAMTMKQVSSLENQALSLTESNNVIVAPSALQTSEDENAKMVVGYIGMANQMSSYLSYMNQQHVLLPLMVALMQPVM